MRLQRRRHWVQGALYLWVGASVLWLGAQPADFEPPDRPPFERDGVPRRGGGPGQDELKLVERFDKDGNSRLNAEERKAAREFLQKERAEGRGRRGFGGPRGGESQEAPLPGARISPKEAKTFPGKALYDPDVVRTLFLEFDNPDWEKELVDFNNTDVDVPAKLTVDGKTYPDVGVHFRGASSFNVGEGRKRSLNLSMDYAQENQRLEGYRTLNLLNSHGDATFLRTILYYHIAREYIAAPKANYARVVINGENWGVYVNAQQFNKDFAKDWFGTSKGARWKVPGSPRGQGNLAYLGEDPAAYKRAYQIRSNDDPKSWAALIQLCKVLNQTPTNELEKALEPWLDVDGALKFLALENALINNDGYWVRTSDYNLYQNVKGRFHLVPHDANETFARPGGPGFGRGPRGGPGGDAATTEPRPQGVELDPLFAANDPNKPLISKLLSVPAWRARYLGYVRDIAEKWLDWERLGPVAQHYQSLIAEEVKADTRKLSTFENFEKGLTEDIAGTGGGPGRSGAMALKSFADQRRVYLLRVTAP